MIKNVLNGQISLFDIPKEVKETKEVKEIKEKDSTFKNMQVIEKLINLYSENCTRIVYINSFIAIDFKEKSLFFTKDGAKEMELGPEFNVLPSDKIIDSKIDFKLNAIQIKKARTIAKEKNIQCYIKRKGDKNIILPLSIDHCFFINPKGGVLEWHKRIEYKEEEKFTFKKYSEEGTVKKGDKGIFFFKGEEFEVEVYSVYNYNITYNVITEDGGIMSIHWMSFLKEEDI